MRIGGKDRRPYSRVLASADLYQIQPDADGAMAFDREIFVALSSLLLDLCFILV
jgi:hypothetical protein